MSLGSKSLPPATPDQKRRWELIKARGCLICAAPAEIHHMLSGGRRMGHDYTIGLCSGHHRGVYPDGWRLRPSLMDGSKLFHAAYGSDEELLAKQNTLIGWTQEPVREHNRKSKCTSSKMLPRRY